MISKSPLKPSSAQLWILVALLFGPTLGLPLMAKESAGNPFKGVKPPSSEWKLKKVKQGEIEIGIKDKMEAINIGLRTMADIPISAESFLDQVRTKIMADPSYQGAAVTLVNSQTVGGKSWASFVIKRKDQINQEFWARPIASDQMLNVLFTAVGNYYDRYHADFMQVLQQASAD